MEQALQSRSSNTVEDEETECETKEKKFWFFKPNSCGPLHYPQGENLKKNWHSRTEWKECVCATYLCRAPLCCISLAMGWSCTVLSALSVCARETERDRERVFEGG